MGLSNFLPTLAYLGTILSALFFNLRGPITDTSKCDLPNNFPTGFVCNITDFQNWALEVKQNSLYTAWPTTEDQVLALANWCYQNNFKMRASGSMHCWAPFTVADKKDNSTFIDSILHALTSCLLRKCDPDPPTENILLVKTLLMNSMQVISDEPSNASFWAQPGITMRSLFAKLRVRKLGFVSLPAPGDVTLGGVTAVGAHGTGVKTDSRPLPEGNTYGSISNLILSLKAVVWDSNTTRYVLKTYQRNETEMVGLLVHLGRTFITNITMRTGPLQNLTCTSYTNYTANELFADPNDPQTDPTKTIDYFLNLTGRMETILFPFTGRPWLKVWDVANERPKGYTAVNKPFNYAFSDSIPTQLSTLIGLLQEQANLVTVLGPAFYEYTRFSLEKNRANLSRLWGPANTVLQYVLPTTLRVTANGYAILCPRREVQRIIHFTYRIYTDLLRSYSSKGLYPINGPLEYRVTGVDDPANLRIPGGPTISGICASSPFVSNGPTRFFNSVIWIDVLTYANTKGYATFMSELEQYFYSNINIRPDPDDTYYSYYDYDQVYYTFYNYFSDYNDNGYYRHYLDGTPIPPLSGFVRVEWSKGWAYNATSGAAWSNIPFLQKATVPNLQLWNEAVETLNELDPNHMFSSPLTNTIFSISAPTRLKE